MRQSYCSYTLGCQNDSLHLLLLCKCHFSKTMQGCIPIPPFLLFASPASMFLQGKKRKENGRKGRKRGSEEEKALHQVPDIGTRTASSHIRLGHRDISL